MKAYEIKYKYEGKEHSTIEQPHKGWEGQFFKQVLDRIESLVSAGAIITGIIEYHA